MSAKSSDNAMVSAINPLEKSEGAATYYQDKFLARREKA